MSYLEEVAPSPSIWQAAGQCAYLQLSEAYASEDAEAQRLGWRAAVVEADHLAIMTRAEAVAERIIALADELQLRVTPPTEGSIASRVAEYGFSPESAWTRGKPPLSSWLRFLAAP